jgi:3-hydroxyisobutyrate dehydrogenase-like beta-hydroxyacid dehydrogenase
MTGTLSIGIYAPGAMGSALGRAWQVGGSRVVATIQGRSPRTASLATGLELLPSLDDVVSVADVIVSIGPPSAAVQMADAIVDASARRQARPLVVDLNAISPNTVRRIQDRVSAAGLELLDGSVSGPPPSPTSVTHLYLSGRSGQRLAALPSPWLATHVVGSEVGLASAVKMCTASVYKGFSCLLLQALQTACAHGVADVVIADLEHDFGGQLTGVASRIALAAAKSDRYPAEMREIAETQASAGGDPGVFRAIAGAYEHVARSELSSLTPEDAVLMDDLAAVMSQLNAPRPDRPAPTC